MSTQHIGAAGELLVQYLLLKLGIDSARLTTDSGVDLVVYGEPAGTATTVQVKSMREPTPAGGRGRPAVGWNFPHLLRAEILALTVLSENTVWLLTRDEARSIAQQHTTKDMRRLYWYTPPFDEAGPGTALRQDDMTAYLLEHRAPTLFLGARDRPPPTAE